MNIYENKMADKAAKREIEMQNSSLESYILLAYIKRRIKESALLEWTDLWLNSTNKGKYYS